MNNQLIELLYLKGMSKDALIKLIKYGCYRVFRCACMNGHLEVAKFLLEQGFVKDQLLTWDCQAFKGACEYGHLEVVKFLLEQGFVKEQVQAWNYWAFRSACENGHLEVVKLLLEQGFAQEQVKVLKAVGFSHFKIRYKDLAEKGIVNE